MAQSPWRVPLIHILQRHNSSLTWRDNDFLNYRSKEMFGREVVQEWGYAVFGEVVEGMDVVDKIKK